MRGASSGARHAPPGRPLKVTMPMRGPSMPAFGEGELVHKVTHLLGDAVVDARRKDRVQAVDDEDDVDSDDGCDYNCDGDCVVDGDDYDGGCDTRLL